MKIFKKLLLSLTLVALPVISLAANANTTDENLKGLDVGVARNIDSGNAISYAISSLLDRLPFFLTALAFAAFLYSGGMYVFAMGDATKMETAKKNMTWTVYGMIAMSTVMIVIKIVAALATQTQNVGSINQLIQ